MKKKKEKRKKKKKNKKRKRRKRCLCQLRWRLVRDNLQTEYLASTPLGFQISYNKEAKQARKTFIIRRM